ncbi:MAG TPA: pitrilysin family protein, partial [Bacillales bacterium]|nr:pitrilysin family protein [Bacillales bacterium]
LIQNLYQNHPVNIDIAGTIESISHITKDLLYECYHTFYHPSNMLLFIVGPVDPTQVMNQVRENQAKKEYKDQPEIKRKFEQEPAEAAKEKQVLEMNVQTPKCLFGIKALHIDQSGEEMLKTELTMNVLLDLLFSKSTENYNNLYSEGLIDETFSYDYTQEQGFGFAMIGGDTREPDQLAEKIEKILLNGTTFTDQQLDRTKKKKIGAFLRAINSPEYIANQFTRYAFNDMNLFDVVPTMEKITLKDVQSLASEVIAKERFSVCYVVPKKK